MPLFYHADPATRVVELTVRGMLSVQDYHDMAERFAGFVAAHGPVGVVEVIESFAGFTETVEMAMPPSLLAGIARVALVSDIGWFCPILSGVRSRSGMEIRSFPLAEVAAARDWARGP